MKHPYTKIALMGVMAMSACQVGADPLAMLGDKEWHVTEISGTPVPKDIPVTVMQAAPGTIAGNSGCNRFTGQVKAVQNRVEIGPLAGTRMMCPAPQMKVETSLLTAMAKVATITQEDGQMVLRDTAGAVLIRADHAPS